MCFHAFMYLKAFLNTTNIPMVRKTKFFAIIYLYNFRCLDGKSDP